MSQNPSERPVGPRSPDPSRPGQLPRYKLILHASAVRDLVFVIRTIMELTHYCRAEATHKMWEAYHDGHSQLLVTHKERAELYVEQFADRGLAVTLEAVGC